MYNKLPNIIDMPMRHFGGGLYPRGGLIMPRAYGELGQWAWVFMAYRTMIALLILFTLILFIIFLWKKIQWIDWERVLHEDTNRNDKHKSEK